MRVEKTQREKTPGARRRARVGTAGGTLRALAGDLQRGGGMPT